ncbi:hypothetical protein HHK36_009539 [Tetracentron sinense]|uniref:Uncharacterized protein n=1 Tax=Tetracentron sinense TaxID=13715 RepID=A0A834ZDI9_TETSI|nr:hypothetical protein HHK36_009539 [Tetracentron sinense]
MGLSESEVRCKKHPKHRQSAGVCSFCLRERLSQLSSSQNSTTMASSWSSSLYSSASSSSSSSCSSYSSPIQHHGSISFLISGNNGLAKSRSMAFDPRNRVGEDTDGMKKGGFWSKLLRSTRKRTKEVLMHSRTVR